MYRAACASVGYVGRSDKKDSCGVVYFEKKKSRSVILLHRKHSASVCIRLLILPIFPRQAATPSFTNSCAFLREKNALARLSGPDYTVKYENRLFCGHSKVSVNAMYPLKNKIFKHTVLKADLL